jgi:hypothetical protein
MKLGYGLATAALLTLTMASVAHADERPAPTAREAWVLGFGVGAGQMSCESTENICDETIDESGGLHVFIGRMLSPKMALEGELWVMAHTEDRVTISHIITTIGVRYWLAPRLWIKGGIGGAQARAKYRGTLINIDSQTDTVPGAMVGIGYELLTGKRFALDLQLRGGTGSYDDDQVRASSASVGVGFNWF